MRMAPNSDCIRHRDRLRAFLGSCGPLLPLLGGWVLLGATLAVAAPSSPSARPPIPPGTWLKIDGELLHPGRVHAHDIRLREPMDELRLSGQVKALEAHEGTFTILGVLCRLLPDSRFRDPSGHDVPPARLIDVAGAWVQVRGTPADDGVLDVKRVELLDRPELEVQAPVIKTETASSGMVIHMAGLMVEVDEETVFKGDWSQPTVAGRAPALDDVIETTGSRKLRQLLGPLAPYRWGGELSVTYEHRKNTEDALNDAGSELGNPTFWFTEPDDAIGGVGLWVQWKLHPFHRSSRIELAYTRDQWIEGEILSRDRFGLELRQELSLHSRLELDIEHSPQIYITHRIDKDALPGDPAYRPEAYRETELKLEFRRELARRLYGATLGTYTARRETAWFRERDRDRWGAGAALEVPVAGRLRLLGEYEFRESRSRNEPDLGRDLSYREHVIELAITDADSPLPGGLRFSLATLWKLRSYTTEDPGDVRRFGRSERIVTWRTRLMRPVGWLTPYASWETTARTIDAPGDVEVLLESDDYGRTLVRAGFEWELEP